MNVALICSGLFVLKAINTYYIQFAVAERRRKKRKMHGIPFAPEQERYGGGEVINQAHL